MEGAEIPDLSPSRFQSGIYGSKQVETRSRLTPGGTVVTTTIKKTINSGTHSGEHVHPVKYACLIPSPACIYLLNTSLASFYC